MMKTNFKIQSLVGKTVNNESIKHSIEELECVDSESSVTHLEKFERNNHFCEDI